MRTALADMLLARAVDTSAATLARRPPASGAYPDDDEEAVVQRAREMLDAAPELRPLRRALPWLTGTRPGWLLAPFALLAGVLLVAPATGKALNVLAPPLLGIALWQLAVYALLGLRALYPGRADRPPAGWTGGLWQAARSWAAVRLRGGDKGAELRAIGERFTGEFVEHCGPVLMQRLTMSLHLGAAAFALGAVLGLYLDGMATAYRTTWESTFLDATTVAALLQVLAPAAAVLSHDLPDAAAVSGMADAGVPAAPFIHMWALTLLGIAIAPRLLLALAAELHARSLEKDARLALRDGWFAGILAEARGQALHILMQPYGYRPTDQGLEHVRSALRRSVGPHAVLDLADPLPWDVDSEVTLQAPGADAVALLVSAAQTPEADVHEPLLRRLAARHDLSVVIDGTAYHAAADRRSSRSGAWRALAERLGLRALDVDAEMRP